MKDSSSGLVVHLVAQRAGQRFSLPVSSVREVLPLPELEPVPLAPAALLGSFQLRGEIVPVVCPDSLLAIEYPETPPAVLALLQEGDALCALAFDRVLGVVSLSPSDLLPHPLSLQRPWMAHLCVDPKHQLVTVLDGAALVGAIIERLRFAAVTA
ncbi:MAG: chemotaxis protein CheW [Opitutaceae bacterium]|nr:chemotaxis protein CheW [Opitutaceae bacterium]